MTSRPQYDDEKLFRLSEYLDDSLDPQSRSALERELARDPGLRAELEALQQVETLAREHACPVPDLDWERFTWETRRQREEYEWARRRRRMLRVFVPLGAAAAVLAVSVTAFLWSPDGSRPVSGLRPGPAISAPVAMVTVVRAELSESAAGGPLALVSVSRALPDDVPATVGPVPAGRTVVVATAPRLAPGDSSIRREDPETLF